MDVIELIEEDAQKKQKIPKAIRVDNPVDISLKEAILANLIIGPIALIIFFLTRYLGYFTILRSEYYFHAVITFICFAILPLLYLLIFQIKTGRVKYFFFGTKEGMTPKKIISSLLQGIAMHAGIFYPWITLANRNILGTYNLNFWYIHLITPLDWVIEISFIALNIIMFEYYSKAFIQIQFMEAKGAIKLFSDRLTIKSGKMVAFGLQFIVWMGGHWLEFTWLPDIIGLWNAIALITMSGLLTGFTVYKTENIFGVTLGHILLNILIMVTFT